tara:strand:+ start:53895 stop:54359 length:465 start_codon:yes stop_codon:yes gene_type:complete
MIKGINMSSAPQLTQSVEYMAQLGVVTQNYADKIEHCVDDAVDALSELTSLIQDNPEVEAAIRHALLSQKERDILDDLKYEFIGSQNVFGSYVLPDVEDKQFDIVKVAGSDLISDVFLTSESKGISNLLIGAVFIGDSGKPKYFLHIYNSNFHW